MKIKDSEKKLKPLVKELEKDNDHFLFVHFSNEEDKYSGKEGGMDLCDAIIVIKELVKRHKIGLKGLMANLKIT